MQPLVTVVLPIRNEERHIEACLSAVLAQDYPADRLEVLVVDGMSDDRTREIVARVLASRPDIASRLIDNPGRIVPCAMNRALAVARGDIIARIDGHTVIAPDYISACVRTLEETGADGVGGPMVARGTVPFGEAVALATSHPFGVGGARFHYARERMETDTVYMGTWRRSVFGWAGRFDEEMACNEDDELHYRLRARGGRLVLDPSIRSVYHNRQTARSLWRQYFRYGLWKVRVAQKVPRQMRPRHFVPFAFVAAVAGGALVAPAAAPLAWAWAGVLGLYAALSLSVSASIAARAGWRHLLRLPVVFLILHAAYGTGFALGLVRFLRPSRPVAPHPARA